MKKILVVDDSLPICALIRRGLSDYEYDINSAVNGEEGWEKLLSWKPDLVITDIMMPKLNGIELLERIRGDERTKRVPVLCITSNEDPEIKQSAAAKGATGWVQKPFNPGTWHQTLELILNS